MKINFKEHFADRLDNHVGYLASVSIEQARKFETELLNQINQIPIDPYHYPKSVYFEGDNIRDLNFKGNTFVFRITDSAIEFFGLVKNQDSLNNNRT